jgi:serine/threonine-protein kinase RsbW
MGNVSIMDPETTLRVSAELENLSVIRRFVQETLADLGVNHKVIADVILATDEAATNVIVHGYVDQPGLVEIALDRRGDALVITVRDQAAMFDPTGVPPPDLDLPLDQRTPGGMGVHLIRQLMDEVVYQTTPQGGNELTMIRKGVL